MAETATTLAELASVVVARDAAAAAPIELPDPQIDAQGRAYATGRRKDAVARV